MRFFFVTFLVSFKILDLKGDEKLDEEEVRKMLTACIEENNIAIKNEHIDQILSSTFDKLDTNQDGFIDVSEYKAFIDQRHQILDHMTINISKLIVEHGALLRAVSKKET